ncbi:unnamed protein product [Chondrus crispus]|uniref:Uncharacterized protein n=1 Tax=Chondrus crispus TaxID=2769 RepID=R7Q446_CHOCR|nr:unnamed protein product [Chondrus crispus]CDF32789.1 unnamed protein product [Chondrus crispus]|eukprot:XP_005712590.1 unnamed protein product [Chondrus crispus]
MCSQVCRSQPSDQQGRPIWTASPLAISQSQVGMDIVPVWGFSRLLNARLTACRA